MSCIGCLSTCYLGCNHLTVKVWSRSWLLISIISLHLWSCPWVSKGCVPFMDRGSGDASFRLNTWHQWRPNKEHHLLILSWHQSTKANPQFPHSLIMFGWNGILIAAMRRSVVQQHESTTILPVKKWKTFKNVLSIKQSLGVFVPWIQSNYNSGNPQKIYSAHWGKSLKHAMWSLCMPAFKYINYLSRSAIKESTKEVDCADSGLWEFNGSRYCNRSCFNQRHK